MALALYRRYRPDTFDKVIGQDQVTVPLMHALDEGRLTHAYLFSGPRGCGKTSSARIMARCINCEQGPTSHPCGQCDSCRDLSATGGGSIDVMEIDAASHNGVEDARQLRDSVLNPPVRDRYKIIILDEAHMVTPQGFNALLKTVEEPPERVMFIFATTEPEKVIGTIRSRTHHYPFRLVPPEIMGPYLERVCEQEHMEPEPGVLKLAMRAGGGSVRDTLSVLDQLMTGAVEGRITYASATALLGFTPDAMITDAIDAVIDKDGAKLYDVVEKVAVGGYEPRRFVEDLLARVRDLLVLRLAGQKAQSVLSDTAEAEDIGDLKRQAGALELGRLNRIAEKINATLSTMAGAISPRMRLELLAASLLTEDPVMAPGMPGAQGMASGPMAQGQPGGQETVAPPRVGFIGAKRHGAQNGNGVNGSGQPAGRITGRVDAVAPSPQGDASSVASQRSVDRMSSPVRADAGSSVQPVAAAPQTSEVPGWADGHQSAGAGAVAPSSPAPVRRSTDRLAEATNDAGDVGDGGKDGAGNPATPAHRPTVSVPAAPTGTASVPASGHDTVDTRTVQERWQEVLASLPEQSREYVNATNVPDVAVREAPDRSAGRVTLTFATALAQHAFALAVDAESGGKLTLAVLKAVRQVFGARYGIAPSGTAANGEHVEPVGKMSPAQQAEVKRQIALEATKRFLTQTPASSGIASAGAPGKQVSENGDDDTEADPWLSSPSASPAQGRPAVPRPAEPAAPEPATEKLGGPAHPALTVDIPDGVDPWGTPQASQPDPNPSQAQVRAGVPSAVPDGRPGRITSGDEAWGDGNASPAQPDSRGFPSSFGGGDSHGAAQRHAGVGPGMEPDPDIAWSSAQSAHAFPMGGPSAHGPSAHMAMPSAPQQADPSVPGLGQPDDGIDDESAYSMSDASVSDGQVDLDTIKQMFDVKQVTVVSPHDGENQ